jgi:site-specific DNA-methyltransferase (adenine-specific)
MPGESVDACVTDPPYELGFMGKRWDASGIAYSDDLWREVLRVLKPGAHLLAFGGTRTYHRMACAIEDAGFEIRDSIDWIYGSGFPKSLDVSKAIDKAAGVEREVLGTDRNFGRTRIEDGKTSFGDYAGEWNITAPATPLAQQWQGWGTALKPAHEPIVVARKPLVGTVAANVEKHGTGALNVDGCRVRLDSGEDTRRKPVATQGWCISSPTSGSMNDSALAGRWPPNLLLTHSADCESECVEGCPVTSIGEPSRFFPIFRYQAKASKRDRGEGNTHPTVKPTDLMRWLVRLITPPGGTVLDPFAGSGTTLVAAQAEGFDAIGIEREAAYVEIIRKRLGR